MNSTTTADWHALETYLNEKGPLSWRQTLSQFHDICSAIEQEYSRSEEFGNISIRTFKVTDTTDGITIEYMTNWSAGIGSSFPIEAYMSPERCLDKKTDERSDIYTLGCVMYHCLTGSPPFMHKDREKLKEMQAVDYALPAGRRSLRRYIPDEVDNLINRCMEKDPARRFRNAAELRAEIGKTLQLEDADSESLFKGSKFVELVQNRRRLFALVTILFLSIGCLAWVSMHTAGSDEFRNRIESTNNRKKNRYFMSLEAGPRYAAQLDFGGLYEPPAGKKPIEIMVKGKDMVLFATTERPTLKDAVLEAVNRHLMLWNADLEGIDLYGCKFDSANFEGAYCLRANLERTNFERAHLKQINLSGANLKDANLKHANLSDAILHKANFENADLSGAMLLNADFRGANLTNCNLSNCYVLNGKFNGAKMTNAIFTGVRLTRESLATANLTDEQKSSAQIITGPLSLQASSGQSDPEGLKVKWLKNPASKDSSQSIPIPKGPIKTMKDFKLMDPIAEEAQPPTQQETDESGLTPLEQNILKGLRKRDIRKAEKQQQQQQHQQQQQQQQQPLQQPTQPPQQSAQ